MSSTDTQVRPSAWRLRLPNRIRNLATLWTGLAVLLTVPLTAQPAAAQDAFTLQLEPAAAFWLDSPQSTRFTPGFYLALRPGIALGRVVSLQLSYAMLYTPAADGFTEDGSAHFLTVGARLRPLATLQSDESHYGGGLWLDFNMGYARTDELDRFAFDLGLGYGFQVTPSVAIGPAIRYGQIVQADDTTRVDPNDAQFFTAGLNITFGEAYASEEETMSCPDCAPQAVPSAAPCVQTGCSDRDHDGLCDDVDACPDEAGRVATRGCPVDPCGSKPLIVLVQFPYNSAALPGRAGHAEGMDPVLDAVATAIAEDPTCNVCVMGYASQEGTPEHNMTLSRARANAVQGYLTKRGLAAQRVPTTGMGERCLLVPQKSDVLNRRVEFRSLVDGQSCPVSCDR